MAFELQLEKSLILELDLSFSMLIKHPGAKLAKGLYIGSNWTDQIESTLLSDAAKLQTNSFVEFSKIFAWKSPYKDDLQQHIKWLQTLSISDMYNLLSPLMGDANSFPFDIENQRDSYVGSLEKWYKGYFKKIEEEYSQKVTASVEKITRLNDEIKDVDALIEEVTGGLVIEPGTNIKTVVLFPHIFYRPIFTSCVFANIIFASYSPQFENERDYEVEWITNFGKAISDEIRVRMLQILSQRKVTFTELAKEIGSTKANIHHHLIILRVAKLLRMHDNGDKNTYAYYSLRPNIIESISESLGKKLF